MKPPHSIGSAATATACPTTRRRSGIIGRWATAVALVVGGCGPSSPRPPPAGPPPEFEAPRSYEPAGNIDTLGTAQSRAPTDATTAAEAPRPTAPPSAAPALPAPSAPDQPAAAVPPPEPAPSALPSAAPPDSKAPPP